MDRILWENITFIIFFILWLCVCSSAIHMRCLWIFLDTTLALIMFYSEVVSLDLTHQRVLSWATQFKWLPVRFHLFFFRSFSSALVVLASFSLPFYMILPSCSLFFLLMSYSVAFIFCFFCWLLFEIKFKIDID